MEGVETPQPEGAKGGKRGARGWGRPSHKMAQFLKPRGGSSDVVAVWFPRGLCSMRPGVACRSLGVTPACSPEGIPPPLGGLLVAEESRCRSLVLKLRLCAKTRIFSFWLFVKRIQ